MVAHEIAKAVGVALNATPRPPALAPLAFVKYPLREIQPQQLPDGSFAVRLALVGYEYKHRGPKPQIPPIIDTEEVRLVLNALLPNGLYVFAAEPHKTHIIINIRRYIPWNF